MAKYVLGEGAARKLRTILSGRMAAGRVDGLSSGSVAEYEFATPYCVMWSESSGGWIAWLPDGGILVVSGEAVDVTEDLEPAGGDYPEGWYLLDAIPSSGGTVYLNVIETDEEVSAEFSATPREPQEGEDVVSVAIAVAAKLADGSVTVQQLVTSAVVIGDSSSAVDEVSIDKLNDIELAHFKDGTMDSGRGLSARLRADPETGEITANDESIKLVCKQDGRVIYVPLSGSGSDPVSPEGSGKNPCDHPGDKGSDGGVSPDAEGEMSGGGSAAGGVPADDTSVHPGESDCCH